MSRAPRRTPQVLSTRRLNILTLRPVLDPATSSYSVIIGWLGDSMIRTQVSLDKKEYELAKKHAAALGISVAELIRRAVREHLPVDGQGPWMKYAGFVESGDRRSSQSIDEIVHGAKD
jgi:Ribbon-helix-helix protein, copG family